MEQTKTDVAALLCSAIAFLVAVWNVIFSPVAVDSIRPTRLNTTTKTNKDDVADARLWDDPFAVFQDSSGYQYRPLFVPNDSPVLVIVVPVSTRSYPEDREARIRLRFAVQHALLDQGYEPAQGWLLFSLSAPDSSHIPVQFFRARRRTDESNTTRADRYPVVALVWLPDEVFWDLRSKEDVFTQINRGISEKLKSNQGAHPEQQVQVALSQDVPTRNRQYAVLGPWDSDEIASVRNLPVPVEFDQRPPWIVCYRATIADAALQDLMENDPSNPSGSSGLAPNEEASYEENRKTIPFVRLPNHDDVLCEALLNEIRSRGTLPGQSPVLNVWVFSEWDTVYGRSLVETFRALAATRDDAKSAATKHYWDLHETLIKQDPTLAGNGCLQNPPVKITVIPYLRGLDGASSLYTDQYRVSGGKDNDSDKEESGKEKQQQLQLAQGTTQFDYIRRLTGSLLPWRAPFLQRTAEPDAIVIFGSDTYDKLALLKFLRQELKTCTYLTTDLDALYWDPHYLEYTRDMVVASAFPLAMKPDRCSPCDWGEVFDPSTDTVVQMRDTYQSAAYLAVSRLVHTVGRAIDTNFFAFPLPGLTYRIGNTEPELLNVPVLSSTDPASGNTAGIGQTDGTRSLVGALIKPIAEGESPFWSIAIQLFVIILGLVAVWFDIPARTRFPVRAADELWKWARGFAPETLGEPPNQRLVQATMHSRRACIRRKWKLLPGIVWLSCRQQRIRNGSGPASRVHFAGCPGYLGTDSLNDRTVKIFKHSKTQLRGARTKGDLITISLCLLADLFNLREFKARRVLPSVTRRSLPPDIKPFADYAFSEFRWLPLPRDPSPRKSQTERLVGWLADFVQAKVPSIGFFLCCAIGMIMLVLVCMRPVPFMVGPETRTYWIRILRWVVESAALVVTFFVFYRVCFEQQRFRRLIQALARLIPLSTGLSNRQVLILIARSGELIGNLSIIPCALVFLLFIAHVRPLGGVALGIEELCLLVWALLMLLYSFAKLRSAALSARADIRETYQRDKMTAVRLMVRLKSFVTNQRPIQDDLSSLHSDIRSFVSENSTLPQNTKVKDDYKELHSQSVRVHLYQYFDACVQRNEQILEDIGNYREGVLAPLIASPIFNALLIPVGGAGGISLATWILSLLR